MKRFLVSLYHCEDGITELDFDRASIQLVRLFSGEVEAADEKLAAAQVWIDNVGRYRWEFLEQVQAPLVIRRAQIAPDVVAESVVSLPFAGFIAGRCGSTYAFNNMVETWVMCVCDPEAEVIE